MKTFNNMHKLKESVRSQHWKRYIKQYTQKKKDTFNPYSHEIVSILKYIDEN